MSAQPGIFPAPTPRHSGSARCLVDLLDAAAQGRNGIDCLGPEGSEPLSYADLRQRALACAVGLLRRGVEKGDRLALLLPNTWEFAAAYFGSLIVGAVPVTLPPPVAFGRIEPLERRTAQVLADCTPRLLIHGDVELPALGEPVALAELCAEDASLALPARRSPEDPALIQYTSGSTARPKGVVLSHRMLLRNVEAIASSLRWGAGERVCSWLPLFHDMGLIGGMLVPLSRGDELVLMRPEHFLLDPASWVRTISERRCTITVAPNFAYAYAARRLRKADTSQLDLSRWRVALCGGEPIQESDFEAFCRVFGPAGFRREVLLPCYGLAEATLAVTFTDPDAEPSALSVDPHLLAEQARIRIVEGGAGNVKRVVSCGRPLPATEVRIRREGRSQPEDRVGEIEVRGPSVMAGYLGRPEQTERVLRDGWLRTGDLGFRHAGELYVTGRERDLIIVRGRNHYPEDIEQASERVDGVRKGSAVAVGVDHLGTQGVALVAETREREPEALARLAADLRRQVAADAGVQPLCVALCAERALPKTSSGKRQRSLAWELLCAGSLEAVHVLGRVQQGEPS